jgi:hypothetical protein
MRKELIFAILAGVSIGLIVAFGAWRVTRALKKAPIAIDIKKNLPPKGQVQIAISNLYDFDVVNESPIKFLGIGTPLSDVVVSTIEDDFYTKTTEDGSFEVDVELPARASVVKINDQKIVLVYSTEFEKTEDPKLKSTSYIGTITDISSGTIQIKSDSGDIKQISVTDDTAYVNTLKKNAVIKSTDVALGDYIVSMGYVNGNKVLHTQRILITSPLSENKTAVISGTIEDISKTKLVINKGNDETLEITLPKTWNGPSAKDLEEGQKIIVAGLENEDKFDLRSIFIVE